MHGMQRLRGAVDLYGMPPRNAILLCKSRIRGLLPSLHGLVSGQIDSAMEDEPEGAASELLSTGNANRTGDNVPTGHELRSLHRLPGDDLPSGHGNGMSNMLRTDAGLSAQLVSSVAWKLTIRFLLPPASHFIMLRPARFLRQLKLLERLWCGQL